MARERRAQKSPNGGRRRRRRVSAARVRGPAAARGGSGSLGGGPGGQCRQPLRGDGCSSSPRPPWKARRWWRWAAEVAANCAPDRDARGMSPRRACAHRRGPSRSLSRSLRGARASYSPRAARPSPPRRACPVRRRPRPPGPPLLVFRGAGRGRS